MKALELIGLLSNYPDYEIKVLCEESDFTETTACFPIEICEQTQTIYLG